MNKKYQYLLLVLKVVVTSFLLFILINFLGSFTPTSRLRSVVVDANQSHQIDQLSNVDDDMFTECAIFFMAIDRSENKLANIFSSNYNLPDLHPCDGLRRLVGASEESYAPLKGDVNTRYFYGTRHLFSVLANYFSIYQIRSIYLSLSILAPFALWLAFLSHSRRSFLIVSPLALSMLIGFDLNNMGGNIHHSPGYFIPTLCLSILILYRNIFLDFRKRILLYSTAAAAATYLDTIHGSLPFILAITLIVNQILYHSPEDGVLNHRKWLLEIMGIIILFPLVFGFLILLKLLCSMPFVSYNVFTTFFNALSYRLSSTVGGSELYNSGMASISHLNVFRKLWFFRDIYFFHSIYSATTYYFLAGAAWIAVVIFSLYALTNKKFLRCGRDIAVMSISSLTIVAWYFIFTNHTYIHAQFMGRLGIVPAAAGFMCIICIGCRYSLTYNLGRAACVSGLFAVPFAAILAVVYPPLKIVDIKIDRKGNIDAVSCSNSNIIDSDGKRDIVLKFQVINAKFRLNFKVKEIALRRNTPAGLFSTKQGSFPIGVLDSDMKLINTDRGRKLEQKFDVSEMKLVICADIPEVQEAEYQLIIDTSSGFVKSPPFNF